MMSDLTACQIRSITRQQIIGTIQAAVDGDEQLMKEVWEQCRTEEHVLAVNRELRAILSWLRLRDQADGAE